MSRELVSALEARLSPRFVLLLFAGALAGASTQWLVRDTVAVPLLGSAPGVAVGGAGLLVAGVAYYQYGCLGSRCGCSGSCDGSCEVDV